VALLEELPYLAYKFNIMPWDIEGPRWLSVAEIQLFVTVGQMIREAEQSD